MIISSISLDIGFLINYVKIFLKLQLFIVGYKFYFSFNFSTLNLIELSAEANLKIS